MALAYKHIRRTEVIFGAIKTHRMPDILAARPNDKKGTRLANRNLILVRNLIDKVEFNSVKFYEARDVGADVVFIFGEETSNGRQINRDIHEFNHSTYGKDWFLVDRENTTLDFAVIQQGLFRTRTRNQYR